MTKKQVWRYYCDHCRKGSLSGGHMKNHEKHCTANPERICRMCVLISGEAQKPMAELRGSLNSTLPDFGMARLRELAANCPMCILAAIRQSGIAKWDGDPENSPPCLEFEFKTELANAWQTINDAKAETESYASY